jgi:protein phosphatase
MRAAGQLGRHDERNSIVPRNVITRCLGPHPDVQVDLEGPFSVQLGDVFLLCSDGLTGRISDAEIGTILTSLPPDESAAFLVDLANLRGGTDNITVVVIKITGDCICTPTDRDPVSPVGEKPTDSSTRAHPAWWAALIATLSAALVSVATGNLPVGIIFSVAAVASVLALALPSLRSRKPVTIPSLGEAPYETSNCQVDRQFVKGILGTFEAALDDLTQAVDEIAGLRAELSELQAKHSEREPQTCQRLAQLAARLATVIRNEPQSMSDSSIR